jgi:murein L,D-transpeptidase YafK
MMLGSNAASRKRREIGSMASAVFAVFCLSPAGVLSSDSFTGTSPSPTGPETMLVKSLQEIAESRVDSALNGIEQLLKTNPNFRLAHLIKGDLLLARARPINDIGEMNGLSQQHLDDLREEAKARVQHYRDPVPLDKVPRFLLQMQPEQKYALVADTRKARLYIYRNAGGEARYVADYYISSGKNGSQKLKEGDKKTPIGVYFVTANLPRQKLTDFYGSGAFPIDYPNDWDKRHGRNGFGIWLHGTPSDTYSRPPRASDGCVVLANQDLDAVGATLQVGVTPVIISDGVEWVKPSDSVPLREKLSHYLENWRRDWESGNIDAYIRNYGRDFSSGKQNLDEWIKHKREVNATKQWVKVRISNVGMFSYPGRDDLVVVNFDQEYLSNNLSNKMKKRQYWKKENKTGHWKIVHESAA